MISLFANVSFENEAKKVQSLNIKLGKKRMIVSNKNEQKVTFRIGASHGLLQKENWEIRVSVVCLTFCTAIRKWIKLSSLQMF